MILPIRIAGDPVLTERADKVKEITEEIRAIINDMIETMSKFDGIGLAANQIGLKLRIIVVDPKPAGFSSEPFVIINPEIMESSGEQNEEEGCLSIPGWYINVKRPQKLKVKGVDIDGKEFVVQGENLLARVLQHEIDHIDGKLISDYSNGKEV